jgi:hypothetical protein
LKKDLENKMKILQDRHDEEKQYLMKQNQEKEE